MCTLKASGCSSPLVSLNIVIGADPYGVQAKETIPTGYTESICYECTATPNDGLPSTTFTKELTIIANPLDCSNSLVVDPLFTDIYSYPYDSSGSFKTIALNYEQIFTHTLKNDCILTGCTLKKEGCVEALGPQTNVMLGAQPDFKITATEKNPLGFSLTFCMKCQITPTQLSPIDFQKDTIKVTAEALDCSGSLQADSSFSSIPVIEYQKNGPKINIASSYESIFTHSKKQDCKLVSC